MTSKTLITECRGDNTVTTDLPVTSKTANYTVDASDDICKEFEFDSASAVTCNLPTAASAGNGFNCIIRNIGAGDLTISSNGTEKIDDLDDLIVTKDCFHWIRCDGSSWRSVSKCPTAGTQFKLGTFTRVGSASLGNQSITGVGFKPDLVFFLMANDSTYKGSWGFDDGSTHLSILHMENQLMGEQSLFSIHDRDPAGNANMNGEINSMDSDGFTVKWINQGTGTPTGTLYVKYLALKFS